MTRTCYTKARKATKLLFNAQHVNGIRNVQTYLIKQYQNLDRSVAPSPDFLHLPSVHIFHFYRCSEF